MRATPARAARAPAHLRLRRDQRVEPHRGVDAYGSGGVSDLAAKARTLRELHRPGNPVVLANAWDAATARAVVAAGFPAVATTSSAISHALGYEDGENTPPDEMFGVAGRIAAAVDVPVTA